MNKLSIHSSNAAPKGRKLLLAASALALASLSLTGMAAAFVSDLAPEWLTPERPEWRDYFAIDPVAERPENPPQVDLTDGVTLKTTFYGSVAGFSAGKLHVEAVMAPKAYEMKYHLRQAGISRWFSEAQNDSLARGLIENGEIKSLYYQVDEFEKDDDYRKVELYRHSPDERYKIWSEPEYIFKHPVTPEQAEGTVDPLSALALLGFAALPPWVEPCDRIVEIYDGNRRFNFEMEPAGYYEFRSKRKGRYQGGAWRCKVSHVKIAGYREKDMQKKQKADSYVYLGVVPAEIRTMNLTYFPVLLEGRSGIIKAKLEPRDTMFIKSDGSQIAW